MFDFCKRRTKNNNDNLLFTGVQVNGRNISGNGILVVFNHGVSMEIKATKDVMSILFLGSPDLRNDTKGLMGTWNDNPDDDYLLPDGTILSSTSTTEELHPFGQSCKYIHIGL